MFWIYLLISDEINMAEIGAAVGVEVSCNILIRAVESLYQRVKDVDSGGRRAKLLLQLDTIKSSLADYQKLEKEGKIRFRDQNGHWTSIGKAANNLQILIKKCSDFLMQFDHRSAGIKFLKASTNQFDELLDELQTAATSLHCTVLHILMEGKLRSSVYLFYIHIYVLPSGSSSYLNLKVIHVRSVRIKKIKVVVPRTTWFQVLVVRTNL